VKPAELIAANLAALPHPDGAPRQLAGFATTLLPDPLREQVTRTAGDIGEAIVYLLETSGYRITAAADEPVAPAVSAPADVGHLHCRECDARLLSLNLATPSHIVTSGRALIAALSQLSPECPHHARV
jgi:hypothetical protein